MERLEKDEFLQISKAIEIFDTSYSSVQRLCRKEKAGKRVKKKSNKYIIQYSLLKEHFKLKESTKVRTPPHVEKAEPNNMAGSLSAAGAAGSDDRLIDSLNSQIDFLTSQINSKDSQIDKLLQRQSEQNIIIQTLQTSLSNKIDSSVPLLVDSIKEVRTVPAPPPAQNNDNGFTVAAAILILLTILLIVLFVWK
ncbi:hypothetical protein WAF17_22595 (plasmid) [Bernardetia sp. ABR2-2B]|uniref:hypothetical protein n=1 Tax=Bernardetia sp. ABR2-2B TaxID=3127472 RepID=UPI0030D0DA93